MSELKPCPACGGDAKEDFGFSIDKAEDTLFFCWCQTCGLKSRSKSYLLKANEAWNNQPRIDKLIKKYNTLVEHSHHYCSICNQYEPMEDLEGGLEEPCSDCTEPQEQERFCHTCQGTGISATGSMECSCSDCGGAGR